MFNISFDYKFEMILNGNINDAICKDSTMANNFLSQLEAILLNSFHTMNWVVKLHWRTSAPRNILSKACAKFMLQTNHIKIQIFVCLRY